MTVPSNEPALTGTITFYYPPRPDKDNPAVKQCSFDIVTRSEYFRETGCKRLEIGSSFQISSGPSSARIWLYEVWQDEFQYGTWTEILLVKERTTTTKYIAIADLATLQPGTVAEPGVRFIERHDGVGLPQKGVFRMRIELVP